MSLEDKHCILSYILVSLTSPVVGGLIVNESCYMKFSKSFFSGVCSKSVGHSTKVQLLTLTGECVHD